MTVTPLRRQFNIGLYGGWGARLSMLGAALLYADKTQRALRVYWEHRFPSPYATFSHTPLELIPSDEWKHLQETLPTVRQWRLGNQAWTEDARLANIQLDSVPPALTLAATEIPAEVCSFETAVHVLKTRIDLSSGQSRLSEFPDTSEMVGVHIRRTDHLIATARSPLPLFIEAMRKLPDSTRFYVCTDEPQIEVALLQSFPAERIVFAPRGEGRTTVNGQMHDLNVLFSLSRCQRIIHSYGSSFSRLAARLGNCPRMVIDSENNQSRAASQETNSVVFTPLSD